MTTTNNKKCPINKAENAQDTPYEFYIVDGESYDLRDWIAKHPGGGTWFTRANGRDISVAVHTYHKNPTVLKKILKQYKVDVAPQISLDPSLNVPKFILPENFDARKNTPVYCWNNTRDFLSTLKEKINTRVMQKKIARANFLFDTVGLFILILHIAMITVGVYYNLLPAWIFVILFTMTRTCMAAIGHYHCHRKKNGMTDWGDALFDMQYVGASVVLYDGHVMLHHLYTNSPADVKRTVFTGMLQLPRLWRIPVYTAQRFGQFLTGMLLRWINITKDFHIKNTGWPKIKHIQFLAVRFLLILEFVFCLCTGHLTMWFAQFVLCLWWNLFLIVSSHNFETPENQTTNLEKDWGIFQIKSSFDISVVGIPYIDCFLTGGLSCHRVHHLLPAQKSGFANILSEPFVKETCHQFSVPWEPTKNFVLERLPKLIHYYLLSPARLCGEQEQFHTSTSQRLRQFLKENFSYQTLKFSVNFIYYGFKGVGSI